MSETYTLDIDSDRGKLLVSWNDLDTLAKYAGTQAGFYLDTERDLFKLHDKQERIKLSLLSHVPIFFPLKYDKKFGIFDFILEK